MFKELIEDKIVSQGVALSGHTTFRIGGEADFFAQPHSDEDLVRVLAECRKHSVPYFVLGNGSNLLVSDAGFRGCVISMRSKALPYDIIEKDGSASVAVDAGCSLSKVAMDVSKKGYTGFEFATGIPGTVGGGVVMNAGAYGGEIKDVITGVEVLTEDLDIRYIEAKDLELSYRHSIFSEKKGEKLVVLRAFFEAKKGDLGAITQKIEEQLTARREKQPLSLPSAGSTFKRPEGYFAGKLIMDSGLSGCRVGGASVSTKHCNFVVNDEGATAKDVYELIAHIRKTVLEKTGVELVPEVKLLGEF